MNTHVRIARILVPALVAVGLTFTSSPPAEAALSDCPSGNLCLWSGTNYTGTLKKIPTSGAYSSTTLPTIRSYYNKRSYRSLLFSGASGTGSSLCIPSNTASPNLSGWATSAKSAYLSATVTFC